ncbi:MAG TPA: Mut7-C RNAse domain-containing protein [Longimicrobiaceae bacterium]|jgi:hypothetical protein
MHATEIHCPGCGRTYSAADRFALGRTRVCACGTRVGLPAHVEWKDGDAPRFFADSMLAGLARWLRVLGYDAAHEAAVDDAELVRRAAEERRLVLTRDRGLAEEWWTDGVLLLRAERPLEQLREVADATGIGPAAPFSRCTRCNLPLGDPPAGAMEARVPEEVRAGNRPLRGCAGCGRVYWEGSHTERMRRAVEGALGGG